MGKRARATTGNKRAAVSRSAGAPAQARPMPVIDWKPDAPHLRTLAFDVARHGLPLISLYFLDGSVPRYLLLTAFNLSLGLIFIVGTMRAETDPTTVDPRSRSAPARIAAVLIMSVFLAVVAAVIAIPVFAPAAIFSMALGVDWADVLAHKPLWVMTALIALVAGLRAQLAFEAATVTGARGVASQAAPVQGDFEGDRARSKAAYAAQITIIATFVLLSYVMLHFGEWGFYVLPVIYAAVLVGYDTRPDLARRIFPQMWQ